MFHVNEELWEFKVACQVYHTYVCMHLIPPWKDNYCHRLDRGRMVLDFLGTYVLYVYVGFERYESG